jgi:hypothetical protein
MFSRNFASLLPVLNHDPLPRQKMIDAAKDFDYKPDFAVGLGGQTYPGYKPVTFAEWKTGLFADKIKRMHKESSGFLVLPSFFTVSGSTETAHTLCLADCEIRVPGKEFNTQTSVHESRHFAVRHCISHFTLLVTISRK